MKFFGWRSCKFSKQQVCGRTQVWWFLSTPRCLFTQRYHPIIKNLERSHKSSSQWHAWTPWKNTDTEILDSTPGLWWNFWWVIKFTYHPGRPSIVVSDVLLTSDRKLADNDRLKQSAALLCSALCGVERMRARAGGGHCFQSSTLLISLNSSVLSRVPIQSFRSVCIYKRDGKTYWLFPPRLLSNKRALTFSFRPWWC